MSAYSFGLLGSFEVLSTLGMVLNFLCLCYIVKWFNLKKTVFRLLLTDASIGFVCCFASFCCCFFLDDDDNGDGKDLFELPCLVFMVAIFSPSMFGNFITMEISVLRLYSLLLSLRNIKLDERKSSKRALLLMIFPALYGISIVTLCTMKDIPFSLVVETCIHGNDATMPSPLATMALLVPFILFPIVSLISDAVIVWIIKKNKMSLSQNRHSVSEAATMPSFDKIPVRATVMSALALVPPLAIGIIFNFSGLSKLASAAGLAVTHLLFIFCRCPALTFISFSYKSKREDQFRQNSREMRLRKVIKFAEEERAQRTIYSVGLDQEPLTQESLQFCY